MGRSKEVFHQSRQEEINEDIEYRLRLKREKFDELENESKSFLIKLGMEVRHLPTKDDEDDEAYKSLKSKRIRAWNEEQEYLFKKHNNMLI